MSGANGFIEVPIEVFVLFLMVSVTGLISMLVYLYKRQTEQSVAMARTNAILDSLEERVDDLEGKDRIRRIPRTRP